MSKSNEKNGEEMNEKTVSESGTSDGLEQSFSAAVRAAQSSPDSEEAWDHLEELADSLQKPDEVAVVYRDILAKGLPENVRNMLFERAVGFYDEWFGDNPDQMTSVLSRIIEIDPDAAWAFDRLTVVLTVAEQWDTLLSTYDNIIALTRDETRRKQLLEDAVNAARTLAGKPDRAVDYLREQYELEPQNTQLATSIERLLERLERWDDLVALWREQIAMLSGDDVRQLRLRIVSCCLENIQDPQEALRELTVLLEETPGDEEGCNHLETVLHLEDAPVAARVAALNLLRANYDAAAKPEAALAAVEVGIGFVDTNEKIALLREAGTRHASLANDERAMGQFAALLLEMPSDMEARKQLRQLAAKSKRRDLQAQALVAAAEACSEPFVVVTLFIEAAQIYWDFLDDSDKAIELFARVVENPETDPSTALTVAYNLNELLGAAGRLEEQLQVLERLANLERASSVRSTILGEAARLADALGDPDKAMGLWTTRIEADANDVEALGAMVELLMKNERWEELIDVLQQRSNAPVIPQQRRTDLVLIAKIQSQYLKNVNSSIETWLKVLDEFGIQSDILLALDGLMSQAERWDELSKLLGEVASTEYQQVSDLFSRLGDIYRVQFRQGEKAAQYYAQTLVLNPAEENARSGLRLLVEEFPDALKTAVQALAKAYAITVDWQQTLDILEPRLTAAEDDTARARLLLDAAVVQERNVQDAGAAFSSVARAISFEPTDENLESELLRLAEKTDAWAETAEVLGNVAAACEDMPLRAVRLRFKEGSIREQRLGDLQGALAAYSAVVAINPQHADALKGLIRVAAQAGAWKTAVEYALKSTLARDHVERELFNMLESIAQDTSSWDALTEEMGKALEETEISHVELARDLETMVALWHRDKRQDLESAVVAARRAASYGKSHLDTQKLLASLQRQAPSIAFIDTLKNVHALESSNLDPLREAAEVALNIADDYETKRGAVLGLYYRAAKLWRYGEEASGEIHVREATTWAIEEAVRLDTEAEQVLQAVQLLLEAAKLPFDRETSRAMRIRAANLLKTQNKVSQAIEIYLEVYVEAPENLELIHILAPLLEQEERIPELLVVLRQELELTENTERRLELRLDIVRFVGLLEGRDERVQSLRKNLTESPGHIESIEAVCEILGARDRHRTLADLLVEQAGMLEQLGRKTESATLWAQAASLCDEHLDDTERAISLYERAVDLDCTIRSLDALARLHLHRGAPADAATWLRRRLVITEDAKERVAMLLKLARAQISASQFGRAVSSLETAFEEAPRNAEVRKLLFSQYRASESWESLASALTIATEHMSDETAILAYAREAADVYFNTLEEPAGAVPVLERALPLVPDDRKMRTMLAEGLLARERFDEARDIIEKLLVDYGRRRSAERAQVHLLLARVERAVDNSDAALEQLDMASKMDSQNIEIWQALAELARETGQLERAERAYRTLLLMVRRGEPGKQIGASEVFVELSEVAGAQGASDKASELIESALEALSKNDVEAPRLQAKLLESERFHVLQRVLETRLDYLENRRQRAQVLTELASLFEGPLERTEEALDVHLRAVKNDPGSPLIHDAAWEIAANLGKKDKYIEHLESLLGQTRRDSDIHAKCEILLRLGKAMELEREDLDKAAEYFEQAEATGVREVDVWRAAIGLAQKREDKDEQMRLLSNLASLGEEAVEAGTRADTLYRLAEVQLSSPETLRDGLKVLENALKENPRYQRSARILSRACATHEPDERLLGLYELVVRQAANDNMLLDYLERRAQIEGVTPEQIREGVELALKCDMSERAEILMGRAIEVGKDLSDGLGSVSWALLGLAERRIEVGDLAAAVKWLMEASVAGDLKDVFVLAGRVAELAAGPDGDLTLAIKLYEKLLERDGTARAAWEPLAQLYSNIGDIGRLEHMTDELLHSLTDPSERNLLRILQARLLLETDDRESEAVETLKSILEENPEHEEAASILADYFEKTGNEEEMIALLRSQLEVSYSRKDAHGIVTYALRIGAYLQQTDKEQAIEIYRKALTIAPDDRALLHGLLECMGSDVDPAERAQVMERILANEEAEGAAALVFEIVDIYESIEDSEAVLRVLSLGTKRAPENRDIRGRLEQLYRDRGDHYGLVEMLLQMAENSDDEKTKISMLQEAAAIYREQLSDVDSAIAILRQLIDIEPENSAHHRELAVALEAAGSYQDAIAVIDALMDRVEGEAEQLDLLKMRASIRRTIGDEEGAIADLEEAYGRDPAAVQEALEAALESKREHAAQHEDREAERSTVLRLTEIMLADQRRDAAMELLLEWVNRERDDAESMYALLKMYTEDEQYEDIAKICERLIEIEEGDKQVAAAQQHTEACLQIANPAAARVQLEKVALQQPQSKEIRTLLRGIYEQVGEQKQLARLLKEDADGVEDPVERAGLLKQVGIALLSIDEIEEATPALREALELAPGDPEAAAALADVYLAQDNVSEADQLLDVAIEVCKNQRSPELSVLQHRKSRVAKANDNQEEELSWLKQALLSDRSSGWIAVQLANRAEQYEDWDMAIWALRTIAMMKEDSPLPRAEIFLRQGKIALVRGDERRAKLFARQAEQEDAESEDVKAFLDELGIS